MSAELDSMESWPEDLLAMIMALKASGIDISKYLKADLSEKKFEDLLQISDAVEY